MTQAKNGNDVVKDWLENNLQSLADIVAETAVFCPIDKFDSIKKANNETTAYIYYTRRGTKNKLLIRRTKPKEKKRQIVSQGNSQVYLDENSWINKDFKKITDMSGCKNYQTCHIWPGLAYKEKCFSAVANIVLLPKYIAAFSDFIPEIQDILKYRAYDLFGWYPEDEGVAQPQEPKHYPKIWTKPDSREVSQKTVNEKLEIWSTKPQSIVHKTIAIIKQAGGTIDRKEFKKKLTGISSKPEMTIASLSSDAGNSYGKVFQGVDDRITICSEYMALINKLWK